MKYRMLVGYATYLTLWYCSYSPDSGSGGLSFGVMMALKLSFGLILISFRCCYYSESQYYSGAMNDL